MNRFLLGFALVLATVIPASAQQLGNVRAQAEPQVAGPPADEGTQLFRGLLHYSKIKPLDPRSMEYNSDTIVIVLGDPGRNRPAVARHVRSALSKGGAALIAVDTRLDLSDFLPGGEDVRIVGLEVVDPTGDDSLRGNPRSPFVVPFAKDADAPTEEERLFAGFQRLATNGPAALRIVDETPALRRTVGHFPDAARYSIGNRLDHLRGGDSFAAAGIGPKRTPYRCLAMADQNVLSNDMLYTSADAEPTDNFAFAVRLVPWLQGPESRKFCLFIENGEVVSKFDEFDFTQVKSPSPKMPPLPAPKWPDPMDRKFQQKSSEAISEVATRLEDGDSIKKGLGSTAVVAVLAILLVVVAGILLRLRVRGSILARNYQPIPVDPLRLGDDTPLGSFTHRRLELLRGNDFRAPFAEYVRLLFRERGHAEDHRGDRCPKIAADGRNRQYLTDSVRRLWEEAHTEMPLAYTKWKELEPILAAVRSAAQADRWRFAPDPATRSDTRGSA